MMFSWILLLSFLSLTSSYYTSAPGTSTLNKARAFQASLNRAVSQADANGISRHISDWFVHAKCNNQNGDKRSFTQQLQSQRQLGVVTSARLSGESIYYTVNIGGRRAEYMIGSDESERFPRLLYMVREYC